MRSASSWSGELRLGSLPRVGSWSIRPPASSFRRRLVGIAVRAPRPPPRRICSSQRRRRVRRMPGWSGRRRSVLSWTALRGVCLGAICLALEQKYRSGRNDGRKRCPLAEPRRRIFYYNYYHRRPLHLTRDRVQYCRTLREGRPGSDGHGTYMAGPGCLFRISNSRKFQPQRRNADHAAACQVEARRGDHDEALRKLLRAQFLRQSAPVVPRRLRPQVRRRLTTCAAGSRIPVPRRGPVLKLTAKERPSD